MMETNEECAAGQRETFILTNSMTDRKEVFEPRENSPVKLFTCGPSVYRMPHLGNYRTYIYEDILERYLCFLGYDVHRVINFTDVEDKAVKECREKNLSLQELTKPVEEQFFKDCERLRIKLPGVIPKSSTSVDQAVLLIRKLMEMGIAYRHEKDIFYDPLKFDDFGKLYGLDMSQWPEKKRRYRKDTYPGQRWNLGDFILWHGYRPGDGDIYWDTELGKGRPAWNIQDPAMITKTLGYEVDISCGGVDNLYRHHDYNIAVLEGISGKEFARYWLHGEHLLVDGKKMSKSKGNVVYPKTLEEKGYDASEIRFFLLYGHYRKKINVTDEGMKQSREGLHHLRNGLEKILRPDPYIKESCPEAKALVYGIRSGFVRAMNDDLDVKTAVDQLKKDINALQEFKENGGLSMDDSLVVNTRVQEIDSVLNSIFTQ